MKDWVECEGCWAEFRVVSESFATVEYCPFCGDPASLKDDEEELYEEDEDYNEKDL